MADWRISFEDYLVEKKISVEQFQQSEPARFIEWEHEFMQMNPESFTAQKKFLLNDTRRKYLAR